MKAILTTAAALLIAAPAVMAQEATVPAPAEAAPSAEAEETVAADRPLATEEVSPEVIAGADVFSIEGDDVGTVSDVVFTSTGEMDQAVISFGGFLGFGRNHVAIPVDELTFLEPAERAGEVIVQIPLTRDQLGALPEYEAPGEAEAVTQ